MSEEAWDRFMQHAAGMLARPRFDEGSRDWKHDVAADVRRLLETEREPDRWSAGVAALAPLGRDFRDHRYDLPTPRHANWLKRWARLDAPSLWRALDGFAKKATDPIERFAEFASSAAEAPAEVRIPAGGIVVMGSLFNFALAPESLPMVRPRPFARVQEALGLGPEQDQSPTERYRGCLEFAGLVKQRMEEQGLPVRDMIDVQSLIFIAGYEIDYWANPEPAEIAERRRPEGAAAQQKPYLSVCAIYRDEAPDLREWIEFHRLVGVERFFLYDNRSTDDHLDVLAPYIANGVVVHHDWPLYPGQFEAYEHCMTEHRHDSRWIALQDVDEFLFSPTGAKLPEVLVDYEHHPAVGVNQMMFGSSGHRTRPAGPVIEEHTKRDALPWPFIKNIVDPTRVVRCVNAHICLYDYRMAVDENHQPIIHKLGRTQFTSVSRLRINHYYFKSEADGRAKVTRPMAIGGTRSFDFETLDRELNGVTDETILRYLPALHEALAKPAATLSS